MGISSSSDSSDSSTPLRRNLHRVFSVCVTDTVSVMEDSDDIRRFIENRLRELDYEATVCSLRIGMNRGYLYDYLKKRSPKMMPEAVKIKLAKELKVPPQRLGVSFSNIPQNKGFADDASPYDGADDFSFLPANLAPFTLKTAALDKHPKKLIPGTVVVVDLNVVRPDQLTIGDVVIVQVFDSRDMTKHYATVFRQFLPPDKLVTNSSGPNEIVSLEDPDNQFKFVIKGVLKYIFLEARDNRNWKPDAPSDA